MHYSVWRHLYVKELNVHRAHPQLKLKIQVRQKSCFLLVIWWGIKTPKLSHNTTFHCVGKLGCGKANLTRQKANFSSPSWSRLMNSAGTESKLWGGNDGYDVDKGIHILWWSSEMKWHLCLHASVAMLLYPYPMLSCGMGWSACSRNRAGPGLLPAALRRAP